MAMAKCAKSECGRKPDKWLGWDAVARLGNRDREERDRESYNNSQNRKRSLAPAGDEGRNKRKSEKRKPEDSFDSRWPEVQKIFRDRNEVASIKKRRSVAIGSRKEGNIRHSWNLIRDESVRRIQPTAEEKGQRSEEHTSELQSQSNL